MLLMTTLKDAPMRHISIVLSACLLTTSTFALDAGQNSPPPSGEPPASSEPAKGTDAKETDTKSSAPKAAAEKPEPKTAPERKAGEMSSQAYAQILAGEIRKHMPQSAHQKPGSVTISFTIDGSGRVASHSVQQSSDPALAQIAAKVLASIHTPPPPGGKFVGVQQFNFH
jgi:periplasmic protein TonB